MPSPSAPPLVAGDPARLGPYRLLGRLGHGASGIVYLGELGGRLAAVKALRAELAGDPVSRARFAREADAARLVAPFCTAAVLDADLGGRPPWIASEYVPGATLQATVDRGGPLASSSLLALAVGVAGALAAIHAAGIVHRDLKPGNIILGPVGPRVIDFGVAQLDGGGRLTVARGHPGTPAFMAPEQHEGRPVTPASDVFAWGAVIAFAGTGRQPFPATTPAGVAYRVVFGQPDLGPGDGLDPELLQPVTASLAKDPAARPRAADLLAALTGTAAQGGAAAPVAGVVGAAAMPAGAAVLAETAPAVVWAHRRRGGQAKRVLLVAAGALLVLGLVAGSVAAAWSRSRDGGAPAATAPPPTAAAAPPVTLDAGPEPTVTTRRLPALPAPADLPGAELLLYDDFSVKAHGWPEQGYDEGLGVRTAYSGGAYLVATRTDQYLPVGPDLGLDVGDLRSAQTQVTVAFGGPNRHGVLRLACPGTDDVARLELGRDGRWRIWGQVNTEPKESVLRQGRAALRRGANRVAFTCIGGDPDSSTLALALNGRRLTRFTAAHVRVGGRLAPQVGLIAPWAPGSADPTDSPEAVVRLDDFAYWAVAP